MTDLELLAPARNADIGIAAIDCGADAVYIAGPDFGARKDAGNPISEVARLCDHAHKFGARVFVTVNIQLRDDELDKVHRQMLESQDAGVDAFIIRDIRIASWDDIHVPLHASTQCAIRTVERALEYDRAGCSRIVLERELPLDTIQDICKAVNCEVEFFVHGALCVCYSGDCRLSEYITGRSADRGECIQACRSLYDLVDESGNVLIRNKALLSLKDYNLRERIGELAEAGVCSFKIEGRLKNASYVKNVVRDYDLAINDLVRKNPDKYRRASFGHIRGGFTPDTSKTFNRGYTELYLDGRRGKWSSMDAPKSMGEAVCTVKNIREKDRYNSDIIISPLRKGLSVHNGDGFAFVSGGNIIGFRADVCNGNTITTKTIHGLKPGLILYRNINTAFEKALETEVCHREIMVDVNAEIMDGFTLRIQATSEDGRTYASSFDAGNLAAENRERAMAMLKDGLSKHSGIYHFRVSKVSLRSSGDSLPLMSASAINSIRREMASWLDSRPCKARNMNNVIRLSGVTSQISAPQDPREVLMRSRYCIRYELGICPRHQGSKASGQLFLINNSRRFALHFDCKACEMTVTPAQK